MPYVWGILLGTPPWVYALLALLVWLGLLSARARTVHLARVLITPAVFIAWGSYRLVSNAGIGAALYGDWLAGALVGAGIGAALAQMAGMQADRAAHRVRMPGRWLPLVRNLVIFGAKYAIAVSLAMQPQALPQLLPWDFAISGAAAGFFLGWLFRFVRAYRRTPAIDITRAPAA